MPTAVPCAAAIATAGVAMASVTEATVMFGGFRSRVPPSIGVAIASVATIGTPRPGPTRFTEHAPHGSDDEADPEQAKNHRS
jgi:hypothetical protein